VNIKTKKIILAVILIGIITCLVLIGVVLMESGGKDTDTAKTSEYQYSGTKPTDEKDKGFKVIGYYPDWEPDKLDRIDFDVVTHINYAFAIPTEDGDILPFENEELLKKLINQAHDNNVKVMMSVGGWSYKDVPLESVFADATKKGSEKLGDEIIKRALQFGFDGVDMDWEHPRYNSGTKKRYEELMLYLDKKCEQEDLLLTIAVISGVDSSGRQIEDALAQTDAVLECVDWVNVMAYDGGTDKNHSPYKFAPACGDYWIKTRGVPAKKVNIGLPFYARPSWSTYQQLLDVNPDADKTDTIKMAGKDDYYNGIETITNKTKWAKENAGGVMIWELSQDTLDKEKSLLCTIGKAIE